MNQVIETLLARRSTRSFEDKQITKEELDTIVKVGLHAPTGMNRQPWHFVVIQDKQLLNELEVECSKLTQREGNIYGAPTLIIVYVDMSVSTPIEDGSLAIGNMYHAANALGIGACWINSLRRVCKTEVGMTLSTNWNIPEGYEAMGSIALGYAAQSARMKAGIKQDTITYID